MSRRSLAILSDGRLSDSQRKALTLLSLGWLELIYVPEEPVEKKRRKSGYIVTGNRGIDRSKEWDEFLRNDDEEVLAIIRTFIQWEH